MSEEAGSAGHGLGTPHDAHAAERSQAPREIRGGVAEDGDAEIQMAADALAHRERAAREGHRGCGAVRGDQARFREMELRRPGRSHDLFSWWSEFGAGPSRSSGRPGT